MKTLHLTSFDDEGGAARAASRLHRGLLDREVESWIAVRRKGGDGKNVLHLGRDGKIGRAISVMRPYVDALPLMFYRNKRRTPWTVAWLPNNIKQLQEKINPDIVHVHWIGTGFMSLKNINQLKSRIVWSLHDAWPFTGGCHVIGDCIKFKSCCNNCPQLNSNFKYDLSYHGLMRKKWLYKNQQPVFIAPSKWIADQAKSSILLSNSRIEIIPNGLDTNVFQPLDKQLARKMLGLDLEKKIILFGAMSATSDPNKGFDKLKNILTQLRLAGLGDDVELAVFGAHEPEVKIEMGFRTSYLGRFHDDISLAAAYSSADVMCVPSIQESFCQTAVESMACGTPVVSFSTSGLLDIIKHGETGFLTRPFDEAEFAKYLKLILTDSNIQNNMSFSSRERVIDLFDIEKVTSKHLDLYNEAIL